MITPHHSLPKQAFTLKRVSPSPAPAPRPCGARAFPHCASNRTLVAKPCDRPWTTVAYWLDENLQKQDNAKQGDPNRLPPVGYTSCNEKALVPSVSDNKLPRIKLPLPELLCHGCQSFHKDILPLCMTCDHTPPVVAANCYPFASVREIQQKGNGAMTPALYAARPHHHAKCYTDLPVDAARSSFSVASIHIHSNHGQEHAASLLVMVSSSTSSV